MKVMIFSNRRKVEGQNFTFGTEKIPIIDSYTYLGIPFTKNGNLRVNVGQIRGKV